MIYEYDIELFKCGTCSARNHCEKCGGEIADVLDNMPGVVKSSLNIPDKTATVETDGTTDEDDILDTLEHLGVLV